MSIEVLLNQFKEASDHPYRRIKAYKEQGKKVIYLIFIFEIALFLLSVIILHNQIRHARKYTSA